MEAECLLWVLVVWKRAAILRFGSGPGSSAFFGGRRPVFRIFGVWVVLAGSDALERRFEPEVA